MVNRPIPEREIHIWQISHSTIQGWGELFWPVLSTQEKTRADRYLQEEKKNSFLYGRGLLRVLLGAYLDLPPARVDLARGRRGKPALPGSSLAFNLSHSSDHYLLAFACRIQLGVDLQHMYQIANPERIIDKFFSREEKQFITAASEGVDFDRFFSCWVRKEAYLKGLGDGLTRDPSRIAIPSTRCSGEYIPQDPDHPPGQWTLRDLPAPAGFRAALAADGRIEQLHHFSSPALYAVLRNTWSPRHPE